MTGLIGGRWTAGNRLEPSRPNGRGRTPSKSFLFSVVTRQRGGPRQPACRGWGVPVAESVLAPPGPIPNPVVTQRSAGEYCGGDPTGGEAAADTPHPQHGDDQTARRSDGQTVRRP